MEAYLILIMVVGMCMDAFAVSIGKGLALKKATVRDALIIALWFGSFHAIMPMIGHLIGQNVYDHIKYFDHWIIFIILMYIAGKMIYDVIRGEEESVDKALNFRSMFPLSIAVSLDALAAGLGFAAEHVDIFYGALNLGVVAALMSFGGVYLGNRIGDRFGKIASIAGAILLAVIAFMILLEGLTLDWSTITIE